MAEKNRSELKTKFENGDVPFEDDYIDLIDSGFNKTDDDSDSITEGDNKFVNSTQKSNLDDNNFFNKETDSASDINADDTGNTVQDSLNEKLNIADIDDTPADDADTAVSSQYLHKLWLTGASVSLGTDQTGLSASVFHKVNFDTELYDNGNNFDNTTDYEYTVPYSGIYLVTFSVYISSVDDQIIFVPRLLKNSTEIYRDQRYSSRSATFLGARSVIINANQNDTLHIEALWDGGVAKDIIGAASRTYFQINALSLS